MILTKCPVRIGIAGGSTDIDPFIEKHGRGSVINFPINVYSHIFLHKDVLGYNTIKNKYTINYSIREEVSTIGEIQNDVVNAVLGYFDVVPCWVTMTSDVFAVGSGLALSSSYMNSLVKAVSLLKGIEMSNYEVSRLAMTLERQFNPLLGYQDTYGCGMGSLKRIDIERGKMPKITYLNTELFYNFDMYLVYTNVNRSSTNVLKTISVKDDSLLHLVDDMEECIQNSLFDRFIKTIEEGWRLKKKTSPMIIQNEVVKNIDETLSKNPNVLCHRLSGAGNGGFFMVFAKKGLNPTDIHSKLHVKKVSMNHEGVTGVKHES